MHGGKEHWNGSKKTSNPFNEITMSSKTMITCNAW